MHLKPFLRNSLASVPIMRPKKGCHHWKMTPSGEKLLTLLNALAQVIGLSGLRTGSAPASSFDELTSNSVLPGKKMLGYSLRNEITWTEWPRRVSSCLRQ